MAWTARWCTRYGYALLGKFEIQTLEDGWDYIRATQCQSLRRVKNAYLGEEVREVAEKMIAMNDPAKGNTETAADASERLRGTSHPTFLGGSEYLQQKITFARDILAR